MRPADLADLAEQVRQDATRRALIVEADGRIRAGAVPLQRGGCRLTSETFAAGRASGPATERPLGPRRWVRTLGTGGLRLGGRGGFGPGGR